MCCTPPRTRVWPGRDGRRAGARLAVRCVSHYPSDVYGIYGSYECVGQPGRSTKRDATLGAYAYIIQPVGTTASGPLSIETQPSSKQRSRCRCDGLIADLRTACEIPRQIQGWFNDVLHHVISGHVTCTLQGSKNRLKCSNHSSTVCIQQLPKLFQQKK